MPAAIPPEKYAEHFWSKVQKTPTCWLWQGTKHKGKWPYGTVRYQRKCTYAHRVAWILTYGAIPEGFYVLHDCPGGDNPSCVNPAHLFLGTLSDNTYDAIQKGRFLPQQISVEQRYGDASPVAKLTLATLQDAEHRYHAGETQTALAKELGIHQSTLSYAFRGKTWHHRHAQ